MAGVICAENDIFYIFLMDILARQMQMSRNQTLVKLDILKTLDDPLKS